MITFIKTILTAQFEAALCMLNECIQKCSLEYWQGKIDNDAFRG